VTIAAHCMILMITDIWMYNHTIFYDGYL